METHKPLLKDRDGEEVDVHMYRSMNSSLMYLTSSRPDIMFAVCACARYQVNPKVSRLYVVERIFRSAYKGICCINLLLLVLINATGMTYYCQLKVNAARNKLATADDDVAVNEEVNDNLEKAATTTTSLDAEHDRGVNTPRSGEDSMRLNELMELCIKLQQMVLDLETTKTTQALEIDDLKRSVKKLKRRKRSRTHGLKRLYKVGLSARVESSTNKGLGEEDASKQGKICDIDADDDITLDVYVAQVQVTTAATTPTILIDEATLAQALAELKYAKPKTKVKGIVFHKPEESTITTTPAILKPKSQMFDRAFKRVNTFVDYRTELVEESSMKTEEEEIEGSFKKARTELEQESSKKQKIDDDKDTNELKQLVKIIPDEEGVAIATIPLAIKPPSIIDWKIHKEGKKTCYQIIRADGTSKMYLVFIYMLKYFDKEDVETL
nr:putative ribonuclease H-like domain-containing protein [Tanacetum cinerariifolium]